MDNKAFMAILLCSLFASSIAATMVYAQTTIPTPSVPEFTLKSVVDDSYYSIPTYSTDPYTGQNVTIQAGSFVENNSIEVVIKNQPFISYTDANSNVVSLYYSVRCKGHSDNVWRSYSFQNYTDTERTYIQASNSDYTIIAFGLACDNSSDFYHGAIEPLPAGSEVDFQAQAFIGYCTSVQASPYPFAPSAILYHEVFTGETSNWSSVQTTTIPEPLASESPSPSPTPSPTPTLQQTPEPSPTPNNSQENFTTILILAALVVVVIVVALLVYFRKKKGRNGS